MASNASKYGSHIILFTAHTMFSSEAAISHVDTHTVCCKLGIPLATITTVSKPQTFTKKLVNNHYPHYLNALTNLFLKPINLYPNKCLTARENDLQGSFDEMRN
jgi:hypothetical protein